MKKRFKNRWKVLLGLLIVATLFALLNTPPQFNDRPIRYWIEALYHLDNSNDARADLGLDQLTALPGSEPRQAIRFFGTYAIPILLREFGKRDTLWSQAVQTQLKKIDGMLPTPMSYLLEPQGIRRHRGLEGLIALGPEAAPAIPVLNKHLNSLYPVTGRYAAIALGFIGPESIPSLFEALSNPNPKIRSNAATGIQLLSPFADSLVTNLLNELGLEWNKTLSWSDRSLFDLTAGSLLGDCLTLPAYPELGRVIKDVPLNRIDDSVEKVLKDFDPTTMQRSSAYLSTQALYRFVEARPVFHCAGSPAIEPSTRSFISKAGRGLLSFPKSECLPA